MLESWSMKKILAIVVLGLLFQGCYSTTTGRSAYVTAYKHYSSGRIYSSAGSDYYQASQLALFKCTQANPSTKNQCLKYSTAQPGTASRIVWLDEVERYETSQGISSSEIVKKPEQTTYPPKQKTPKEVSKTPNKKIIKSEDVNPNLITIGSGSGFYINNKGFALTNNHVIDICAQSIAVIDGKETLFRVVATDKTNDVAVLKTDYKSRNYIKINEDGAKLGENVIAVGYPLAGRLSDSVKITRGIVSSLSGLDNNIGQIQIDAALQPGNSGGPVLNENGELVGIASAGLNKLLMAKEAKYIPENVNFAVASPIVVNILKSKKVKYTTPSMFSGSYSNTELAELGDSSTIQLFCRNTRTAYNRLKSSNKYSTVLLDLD